MKKTKIIALIIPIFMIVVSFTALFNSNVNYDTNNLNTIPFSIPSGFTSYNVGINVKNYTIPNEFYNFTGYAGGSSGNNIITKYSPTHTLTDYYYGTNGELDRYIFENKQYKPLTPFLEPSWNTTNMLMPDQLTNGSINIIGDINDNNNHVQFDYYNLYNNTNIKYTTTINYETNLISYSFSDNYFYWSYGGSISELYNVWINLTTYHYYYLNVSEYNWNSVNYFNAGNSWFMSQNDKNNNTNDILIMRYSASSNSFVESNIYSNSDTSTANFYYDYNNEPFIESKLSNGTYLLTGLQEIDAPIYYASAIYYNPISNSYKTTILYNINITPTDLISFNMFDQNQYDMEGGKDNASAYAFVNIYNKTVLNTNNSWFNYYIQHTPMGFNTINGSSNNGFSDVYFGYSGWENAISNSTTNKVMLWYLPNKVNEFSPYGTINKYTLTIKENGLPLSTQWTYNFNGTSYTLTNNSYNYSLINGNYALSVSSVNGYNVAYPSTITIDNASKIAYVNFTAIPKYSVTIQENGLPANTQWNFTIKHSGTTVIAETLATSSYIASLQNDTYDLYAGTVSGYNLHIHTSPFTVSGSAITEYVNYTAIPTYTLFLKETGLASGTSWIAYVGSTQYTSSNAYINVTGLTNGTYSLSIDNVADYSLGSYPTSFTVSGSNYYINITFTHNTTLYQVKFIANHIPNINAITWTIVFNGTQYASKNSNTIIVPSLKNGSYSLVVNSVSGYVTDKYPSTISISGSNITQELYFNETFSFQVNETGYSGQWFIIFNGTSYSSSTSTLIISGLVNYSYPLSVTTPTGYSVSSYPNIIKINGNNEYLNIIFTKTIITKGYFIVEFVIAGYRGNISIIINNVIYYTTNGYKNVTLPNGSYNPVIELPSGYELAQPLPTLNVNGNNTVYPIYVKSYIDWQKYEPVIVIGLLLLTVLIIPAVVRAGRR